jgi:class 3 adenylate cyclase
MNLFFKSYRYCLIFFLLITCESGFNRGIAQDNNLYLTPWIQEIILPSPNHEIPNETFYRNQRGTLFIGKSNGLTIISGKKMSYLQMGGPVYVGGNDSDTLFYAAQNDLGFLVRQQNHVYNKTSRVHLLPASRRTFSPTGFSGEGDQMVLCSDHGTYRISRTDTKFLKDWHTQDLQPGTDTVLYQKLVRLVGDKTGITLQGIRQVFRCSESETWILGAYSLHRITEPSPLSIMETGSLVSGRILNSQVSRGRILLGTTHGIYNLEQNSNNPNQWTVTDLLIEDNSPVKLLHSAYNQTIAAGPERLYLVRGDQSETIDKGSFTGIRIIRQGSLVASGNQGLVRYDQRGSGWVFTIIDPSLTNGHSFVEYRNQLFFLCKNGVFSINHRAMNAQPIQFQTGELLFRMIELDRELLLIGSHQVYRYDEAEETFHPMPQNRKTKLLSESRLIIPAAKDEYWILKDHGNDRSRVVHTTNLEEPDADQATYPVLQNLDEIITLNFHDSTLYLTGKNKISLFDLRRLRTTHLVDPVHIDQTLVTDYTIGFRFTGLELQNSPEPLFRQRILPGDEDWSEWHRNRNYTVSRLKPGSYTIEAEAMDLYGHISEPAQMMFSIATPFYASWYAFVVYGFLFLVGLFLFRKWRLLGYQRAESRISARMESRIQSLAAEKELSDKLVAEILPQETAKQIKSKGKAKWDKYERATVLFSDIQGFTKIAEEMNPEALIDELDKFFFHFDSVVEKYNIEKIKTIGDAYMAAGGIPHKNSTNPVEVVLAALEMQSFMQQLKSSGAHIWDLRIGIHTGPVIAGVVGHKKISYDIWGDTVNTASRMESSGIPGKINISSITYGMVKEYFLCEYRGKLPVKYKGNIDMYFVNGLRPELSVDLKELPNKRFFFKLQLLRLGDLEDKVFNDVLKNLPESLHFHRLEHARKVYNQSFLLCRSEEIEQEDRLLVRTAALLLFTGLTQAYHNFENRSSVICREILPDFEYSETQIDHISNLILATKMPSSPTNRLETILIDAKMEYIGRPDYTDQIKLLFQEMKEAGAKINGQQFKKQQLELLYKFEFYTLAAKRLREVSGPDQMSTLEQERWI